MLAVAYAVIIGFALASVVRQSLPLGMIGLGLATALFFWVGAEFFHAEAKARKRKCSAKK